MTTSQPSRTRPRPTRQQLALQREVLVRRSMLLREQIALESRRLQPRMKVADTALDAVAWAKANPGIVATVLGSVFVLRPKRMLKLGVKAFGLWRVGTRVWPVLRVLRELRR